ncbi:MULTISPECIES: hypothetical protein [Emticicia]|uniref:hypothetical protein n=1 Tax=Emticicia TaxID=312278 RepID=UPI0020A1D752|nr:MULTISPECIES: hypothetical protein [Emticicia]UTA66604.1 hypothetical protein MB380_13440 [Emticicia sp. 21SJ11W-3]
MRRRHYFFLLLAPLVAGVYMVGYFNIPVSKRLFIGLAAYMVFVTILRILFRRSSPVRKFFGSKEDTSLFK